MTTTGSIPSESSVALPPEPASASLMRTASESADAGRRSESSVSPQVALLPVQLDVCIPLPRFRVQDLITLEKGRVLATGWPSSEDLPLYSGDVQLVWTEFEVVDQRLAVRVTRLV